jgi:hypothetical protein
MVKKCGAKLVVVVVLALVILKKMQTAKIAAQTNLSP